MKKTIAYKGTAQDIGCEIFINHTMPIIRQASLELPGDQLALLYAGFFSGMCGSMAADFGKDVTKAMINAVSEQLDSMLQEVAGGMMQ